MREPSEIQRALVDASDSVLVVIDVQDVFIDKVEPSTAKPLVDKIVWLIKVARCLDVPVVAMAEDIAANGTLTARVLEALPDGTVVHDKDAFALTANPAIAAALEATGRRTAVCVGFETDVCVAQSAIGLLGAGYRVMALRDAVGTTEGDQTVGLERMRDAGVAIGSVKALYYEWTRCVSRLASLKNAFAEIGAARPKGLLL